MPELNAALEDIKEITVTRPELTMEEWEIVGKATDWIKSTLKPEVRKELEVEYTKKYAEFQTEMSLETKRLVKEHMDNWQKEQSPLSQEELGKLLSQEYIEFALTVKENRGARVTRNFTIIELPEAVEKRFLKAAQSFLVPLIQEINAAEWTLEGTVLQQINGILQKSPAALDAACELAAIVLDPWEDQKDITKEWVQNNLSTPRISNILSAQMEANKYRDFFLQRLAKLEDTDEVDDLEKTPMPAISAAASWMDSMKLPIREIKKRYTKSELVMMAWDSRLKASNMRRMRNKSTKDIPSKENVYIANTPGNNPNGIHETADAYEMPSTLNKGVPILKKWINEEEELDLRRATGPQAVRYLNALGFNIASR